MCETGAGHGSENSQVDRVLRTQGRIWGHCGVSGTLLRPCHGAGRWALMCPAGKRLSPAGVPLPAAEAPPSLERAAPRHHHRRGAVVVPRGGGATAAGSYT
ncbi:unnamed protein product [Boreogadus saida]